MKWIVERGDECNELYITQDEVDDAIHSSMGIVGDFMRQYPSTKIDTVKLVIQCNDEPKDDMPCFNCEAFGDDEQCYNKRHIFDGCPRIKNLLNDITINSTKEVNK